jgi:hypothetical protein
LDEKRVRDEQKVQEKKARDAAKASQKERLQAEKQSATTTRGVGVGGVTDATTATAVKLEGTATMPDYPTAETAGDTVHDKVTVETDEAKVATNETAHIDGAEKSTPLYQDGHLSDGDAETKAVAAPAQEPTSPAAPMSPTSGSKRDSRVKSWFKKIKTGSKSEKDIEKPILSPTEAGRTGVPIKEEAEEEKPASGSIRDVALAGKGDDETDDMYGSSPKPATREPVVESTEPGHTAPTRSRSISPVSSALSEEPHVIAADAASSRYSVEHSSKRYSGADQVPAGAVSDSDDEPRGRKGFRERFLKKVIPGRKSATEAGTFSSTTPTISEQPKTHHDTTVDTQPRPTTPTTKPSAEPVRSDSTSLSSEEAPKQEDALPLQSPMSNTTADNDDDDFEEARDTFDEERLTPAAAPAKAVDVRSAKAELIEVGSPTSGGLGKKNSASPVGSRASQAGSRFTEEL